MTLRGPGPEEGSDLGRESGDDVGSEVDFHLAERTREFEEEGLRPVDARRAAEAAFGDVDRVLNRCDRIARSDARRRRWKRRASSLWHDVALAARAVRRSPGFTAIVVLTLALGIGANHTMLRIVDQILLRAPPAIEDPDGVVRVFRRDLDRDRGAVEHRDALSYPTYSAIAGLSAFSATSAYAEDRPVVGLGEDAYRAKAQWVSGSFFPLLGVEPALGRLISDADDQVTATPTAVLSWEQWMRRFGHSPDVLGTQLRVGSITYRVIGVAPRDFFGPSLSPTDIWLPLRPAAAAEAGEGWETADGWSWLRVIARLAPDVDGESAELALARVPAPREGTRGDVSHIVRSLRAADEPDVPVWASVSLWLGGLSVLVWLIAALNVGNLYLAREVRRARATAVRVALGLSRWRIARQFLLEVLLVALVGSGIAALVSIGSQELVGRVLLPQFELPAAAGIEFVLLVAVVTALVTAATAGTLPAARAVRRSPARGLGAGRGTSPSGTRVQDLGLAIQASLCVVLLVAAGLFVRSLTQVGSHEQVGLDPDPVALARVFVDAPDETRSTTASVIEHAVTRVSGVPGVEHVATSAFGPFADPLGVSLSRPNGSALPSPTSSVAGPDQAHVSPGFFRTLGVAVRGRVFMDADAEAGAPPVAIASRSMAELYWPGQEALGECLIVEDHSACTRIVGVASDLRRDGPTVGAPLLLYLPLSPGSPAPREIWVRGATEDPAILTAVRREVLAASPTVRFVATQALGDRVADQTTPWRLGAIVCLCFGGLALLVASVGVFSLMTFKVARGEREFAVRSALGASPWRTASAVLGRGTGIAALGVGLGLVVSAGASPWMEPVLFDSSGIDVGVYAIVAMSILAVAVLATVLPALRAIRTDPARVLRSE